jgi:geranylgeranyl diphosphate synthase type II
VPIAVNVGDAMFALTLRPLLENIGLVGLGPALQILEAIAKMVQESVHGQAVELDWVSRSVWEVGIDEYVNMVVLKTGWYSFITPMLIGGLAAGASRSQLDQLTSFATQLSVAFQIQDDILNLDGDVAAYGKEIGGDLWEGKRTVIVIHLLQRASADECKEVRRILAMPRPANTTSNGSGTESILQQLVDENQLTEQGRALLLERLGQRTTCKTSKDVAYLMTLINRYECIPFARELARNWTDQAGRRLQECNDWLLRSAHKTFLEELVTYVYARLR